MSTMLKIGILDEPLDQDLEVMTTTCLINLVDTPYILHIDR